MNKLKIAEYRHIVHMFADDLSKMQKEKEYLHHGTVSCYSHSISVAETSLRIAMCLGINVNIRSLIRGTLLHDYYLYDWHKSDSHRGLHGFHHAKIALENAERDFELDDIQRDIIKKHMFPMNITLPQYRETIIVTIADKICAARECFCECALYKTFVSHLKKLAGK